MQPARLVGRQGPADLPKPPGSLVANAAARREGAVDREMGAGLHCAGPRSGTMMPVSNSIDWGVFMQHVRRRILRGAVASASCLASLE